MLNGSVSIEGIVGVSQIFIDNMTVIEAVRVSPAASYRPKTDRAADITSFSCSNQKPYQGRAG